MNRRDLDELLSVREDPCLSILAPMERKAPDTRQNEIRVKNLVREATARLEERYGKREVLPLVERLHSLSESLDGQPTEEGLALFVSRGIARRLDLPFSVSERIVIDDEFATREIVVAIGRSLRYRVLVLGDRSTRLLEGTGERLVELLGEGFPIAARAPGEPVTAPGALLAPISVDHALGKRVDADPLPLAVVGVERQIASFQRVSRHTGSVIATFRGSHDLSSAHELSKLVWPVVEAKVHEENLARARRELDLAIKTDRLARGIEKALEAARAGRGAVLLVEEGSRSPTPDAVDEIVDEVLRKHGDVIFVPEGTLGGKEPVALTLRYRTAAAA